MDQERILKSLMVINNVLFNLLILIKKTPFLHQTIPYHASLIKSSKLVYIIQNTF